MEQWTVSSLMSLLPQGLAVGPSLSFRGALGLWWVGLPLEAGSELPTGQGTHQDSTNHTEETSKDKSTILLPLFLRFACRAQRGSLQNLSVQTQGRTIHATRTIQTGTELLLDPSTEPEPITDGHSEKGQGTATEILLPPEEKTMANAETDKLLLTEEERGEHKMVDDEGNTRQNKTDSSERSKMSDQEKSIGLKMAAVMSPEKPESAPPTVRCSVRLTSKPRLVHSLSSRLTPPLRKPALSARERVKGDQGRGQEAEQVCGGVAAETTVDGITTETAIEGQVKVRETSGDDVTADTTNEAVTMETTGGRERRHTCETCGKKFFQKSHLDKHKFTHSSEKPFTCDQCEKTYSSKESYRAHQLFHQGERPFPCPLCPKAYGLKRDLKEHLVLHSGLRPYRCQDCGRGFTRRPSLRVHQLIHCVKRESTTTVPKVQEQVQCSVCCKFLSNSGSLKNHMKVHTGERKHMCQDCGKSFSQKGNLVAHMRTHTGEQPFKCTVCGLSFSQWKERQRHQQEHSGTVFLCSICGKVLKDTNTLRAHEALHSGARSHPCPHCPKGYVSASKLRCHLRSAHSTEKPFTCRCGAAYALRQSLTRHQALHRMDQTGVGPQPHGPPVRGRPREEPRQTSSEEVKPGEHTEEGPAEMETELLVVQEVAETVEISVEINTD